MNPMSVQPRGCKDFLLHQRSTRRDFIRVGSLALGGLTLGDFFRIQSAQAEQKLYDSKENTAKNVIQIVCQGGIAAQEAWNPKPESPLEYRGPFGVQKTSIPGIVLSEKMVQCAKVTDLKVVTLSWITANAKRTVFRTEVSCADVSKKARPGNGNESGQTVS